MIVHRVHRRSTCAPNVQSTPTPLGVDNGLLDGQNTNPPIARKGQYMRESAPGPDRIAHVVADLDRLGVPAAAGRPVAQAALQAAGRGVSTAVLRAAITARKRRDGVPIPARRKPAPTTADGPRRVPLPPLLAAMADARLAGAACVGRHRLFDDDLDDAREDATARAARHAAAATICASCPVLEACRTVADETGDQARGVWAGHPRNPSRPAAPSRKDLSA